MECYSASIEGATYSVTLVEGPISAPLGLRVVGPGGHWESAPSEVYLSPFLNPVSMGIRDQVLCANLEGESRAFSLPMMTPVGESARGDAFRRGAFLAGLLNPWGLSFWLPLGLGMVMLMLRRRTTRPADS